MILVENLAQLPLVSDRPAYESRGGHAKLLWKEFQTVITLNHIFRQDGKSNEQEIFHILLSNIRDAIPTLEDWMILMSRCNVDMSFIEN